MGACQNRGLCPVCVAGILKLDTMCSIWCTFKWSGFDCFVKHFASSAFYAIGPNGDQTVAEPLILRALAPAVRISPLRTIVIPNVPLLQISLPCDRSQRIVTGQSAYAILTYCLFLATCSHSQQSLDPLPTFANPTIAYA
jgi:hypothetical protein